MKTINTLDRGRQLLGIALASILVAMTRVSHGQITEFTIDGADEAQPLSWLQAGLQSQTTTIAGGMWAVAFLVICAVIGKAYMGMGEGRTGSGWSNMGGLGIAGLLFAGIVSYLGIEVWNLDITDGAAP